MQNEILQTIRDFDEVMKKLYIAAIPPNTKKLILVLLPATSGITGGMISILKMVKTSRDVAQKDGYFVQTSYYPGQKASCMYRKCENNEKILNFGELADCFPNVEDLIIHIPEYVTAHIFKELTEKEETYLKNIKNLQINIMNQNVFGMPEPKDLEYLKEFTMNITQSTAHHKYTSQEICDKWGYPLYAIYAMTEQNYIQATYEEKQNIICYSNDKHPMKEAIINKIKTEYPSISMVEINNLTYEQYKELIASAKYSITFGEGFDGYFSEPILSGSVSFAVYNSVFFPSESYKTYKNIYSSYNEMLEKICDDIEFFESNVDEYRKINSAIVNELNNLYKVEDYIANFEKFYKHEPTFMPTAKVAGVK